MYDAIQKSKVAYLEPVFDFTANTEPEAREQCGVLERMSLKRARACRDIGMSDRVLTNNVTDTHIATLLAPVIVRPRTALRLTHHILVVIISITCPHRRRRAQKHVDGDVVDARQYRRRRPSSRTRLIWHDQII